MSELPRYRRIFSRSPPAPLHSGLAQTASRQRAVQHSGVKSLRAGHARRCTCSLWETSRSIGFENSGTTLDTCSCETVAEICAGVYRVCCLASWYEIETPFCLAAYDDIDSSLSFEHFLISAGAEGGLRWRRCLNDCLYSGLGHSDSRFGNSQCHLRALARYKTR